MPSKKNKEKKEVVDKEAFILPMDVNDAVAKPNQQLEDKLDEIDHYLTYQGLGQNAKQKVIDLINELNVIRDDIAKEEG